jgi:hypothetical protein
MYALVCCLLRLLSFRYYFWLLECVSFLSSSSSLCWCRVFILLSRFIYDMNTCCFSRWRKICAYDILVDFAASIGIWMPHKVVMSLVVLLIECVVQYCVIWHITRIFFCVHSNPWCGSTLDISCTVVYYFAFGDVAQFGHSKFLDILCGVFRCCWLLVRYLRRRVRIGSQWLCVRCCIGF